MSFGETSLARTQESQLSKAQQAEIWTDDQIRMSRLQADTHCAMKMLGAVTRKESVKDLVEDLLGQPGLQEWETYHHAASLQVPEAEMGEHWCRNFTQEAAKRSSRQSIQPQETPQKKRRQGSGTAGPQGAPS